MNDTLVIYSPNFSARFRYIIDWLFGEQLKVKYSIVNTEEDIASIPFFISYGKSFKNSFSIPDAGLLWESGIKNQKINVSNWQDLPTLFAITNSELSLPFDILSAAFFLLSRYEEYYSYTPDKHDRYPAEESILFKQGLLERPILDEWVQQLRIVLREKGLNIPQPKFSFQPTYDIDIAYANKGRGAVKNIGGFFKQLLKGEWKQASSLFNSSLDPYDSYSWLAKLHKDNKISVTYFILAALETTAFDKNISPTHHGMQLLIKKLSGDGNIGLHPSYFSNDLMVFRKEKTELEKITGEVTSISRQHYIKNKLPETYHSLITNKIEADYSMGYGTHLGFRAGTGQSFFWYDLSNETITGLRVYPFCFMDTAALFHAGLDARSSFERLREMTALLKKCGSQLITIFHNSSLGTRPEWKGWQEAYGDFLKENS